MPTMFVRPAAVWSGQFCSGDPCPFELDSSLRSGLNCQPVDGSNQRWICRCLMSPMMAVIPRPSMIKRNVLQNRLAGTYSDQMLDREGVIWFALRGRVTVLSKAVKALRRFSAIRPSSFVPAARLLFFAAVAAAAASRVCFFDAVLFRRSGYCARVYRFCEVDRKRSAPNAFTG